VRRCRNPSTHLHAPRTPHRRLLFSRPTSSRLFLFHVHSFSLHFLLYTTHILFLFRDCSKHISSTIIYRYIYILYTGIGMRLHFEGNCLFARRYRIFVFFFSPFNPSTRPRDYESCSFHHHVPMYIYKDKTAWILYVLREARTLETLISQIWNEFLNSSL